ncbi:SGNH hydrolase domain-containing protein, partial [Francisella orientalis]
MVFSNLVEKLKKEFQKLVIIDPKKAISDDSYYNIVIDNIPIYADSNHLNYIGSELLVLGKNIYLCTVTLLNSPQSINISL